ncbi:MAG TPA: sugar-transfer associated ATP-grasp domain-containing protein, partial [candidate division Zixibacteria bacterium]|nr:sugar-transfer associated ATP-grasp domain-containing protein [candidate division Zixibacteria bacterium]
SSVGLVWGLGIYINIFILSMAVTFILYPLAMEESHRVAIVITITAIIVTVINLIGELYRMEVLESAFIFPVLITSWLADRFVVQVEETDWIESSKQLLGTMAVIVIAYFAISLEPLMVFIALNPESWAVIILINVILALKVSFRLSEYIRFEPILKKEIARTDILGMNRRNQEYIFKHNPRSLFPHIGKDKMKLSFHQLGIPTPDTYAIIQDKKDIGTAEKIMRTMQNFVIKPANGSGGGGILVIRRKEKNGAYMAKGKEYTLDDLKNHIMLILDGQYSSEWGDVAIIEERVETDTTLASFYWGGVPDVRIIVFEGFPVMAMTRLPTKESGGLANIHKGAIGMGLSIADGTGIEPFWRGHGGIIERHPDTNARLTDMKILDWQRYLEMACLVQAASKLGYAGVDIVPTTRGPVVLEVNKRPGLEIQNTNLAGLVKRLEFIEKRLEEHRFKPVQERVRLSQGWDKKGWE